jgi:hypothetical protein
MSPSDERFSECSKIVLGIILAEPCRRLLAAVIRHDAIRGAQTSLTRR